MGLAPHQAEVIETLVAADALRFGDFTLKSGRRSPYFVDVGRVHTGGDLTRLAGCYVTELETEPFGPVDLVFGPAYKGIPLAVAIAISWFARTGRIAPWAFDRKEAKDHGEGGSFVGAPLAGQRVVIVDDVLTAGTAVRAAVAKLAAVPDVEVAGVLLAVNREEAGPNGDLPATRAIERDLGVPVRALVTMSEAAQYLHGRKVRGRVLVTDELLRAIQRARASDAGEA